MNEEEQTTNRVKTVNRLHFVYVILILVIIIVALLTGRLYCNDEAVKLISFGATLASIILSILAIFMTLLSNDSLSNLMHNVKDITTNLSPVSKDLKNIGGTFNDTNTKIDSTQTKLDGLSTQIDTVSGTILHVVDKLENTSVLVKGLGEKIDATQNIQVESNSSNTNSGSFIDTCSYTGLLILYTILKSKEKGVSFFINEVPILIPLTTAQYTLGFFVALKCANLVDYDVVGDGEYTILSLDSSFTSERITKKVYELHKEYHYDLEDPAISFKTIDDKVGSYKKDK